MLRILVVDDEESIRATLTQMLDRAGYHVICASSGEEAMQCIEMEPVDLVIMDLIMPGKKEGMETISDLHRAYPDLKIIAMSGGGRVGPNNYLSMAQKLGAHKSIAKPFDRDELIGVITDVMQEDKKA